MSKLFILSLVTASLLFGASEKIQERKKYDPEKGWWWYEETYKDDSGKEETVKYQLPPAEKQKLDKEDDTNKLLKALIIKIEENTAVNKKALERLEYAFPDTTPEYSINKKTGEKCKTNSSSDCFIMPVIAEGQHVPVLMEFLRNPSPENSKEWLKWQAIYFNHIQKVSHGLRFAFLKDGAEAYPTSTDFALGDSVINSQAESVRAIREAKIIASMKGTLAYLIFVGQNDFYEKATNAVKDMAGFENTFMQEMDYIFVLPSKEAETAFKKYIFEDLVKKQGYASIGKFYEKAKFAVRPELYKSYNVQFTPSVLAFYKSQDGKKTVWQIIDSGSVSADNIRKKTMNFLTYNGIVEEKEISAEINWKQMESKPVIDSPIPKPKDDNLYLGGDKK